MSEPTGASRPGPTESAGSTGSAQQDPPSPDAERRLLDIVGAGPKGTVAVAGIAAFVVFAIWFAFYFLVFLPRGVIQ